jgi:hypothetical protein
MWEKLTTARSRWLLLADIPLLVLIGLVPWGVLLLMIGEGTDADAIGLGILGLVLLSPMILAYCVSALIPHRRRRFHFAVPAVGIGQVLWLFVMAHMAESNPVACRDGVPGIYRTGAIITTIMLATMYAFILRYRK